MTQKDSTEKLPQLTIDLDNASNEIFKQINKIVYYGLKQRSYQLLDVVEGMKRNNSPMNILIYVYNNALEDVKKVIMYWIKQEKMEIEKIDKKNIQDAKSRFTVDDILNTGGLYGKPRKKPDAKKGDGTGEKS